MADQAALQEAIQRARQLAAQMSQNVPVKRPASELDDRIGPVKVTLAYEKPANLDRESRSSRDRESRDTNSTFQRESNHSSRDRDRDRDRDNDKDRDRDRDNNYSGSNGSNSYQRGNMGPGSSSISSGFSMLGSNIHNSSNNPSNSGSSEERTEIIIPHSAIGLVIGKGGENIKRIQNETGATVRVDPNTVDEKGNKLCTITGTKKAVEDANIQVLNVIENAASNKRPRTQTTDGADQFRMKIPASRTGAIIGKGGETIKSIKQQSGCDIELDKHAKECGPEESVFIIRGSQDRIAKARALIDARLASRGRDGGRDGGGGMRDMDHHQGPHHSGRSGAKGVATGANAAPVAQFTDLPNAYQAAAAGGQQNSDVSAAWAAYFAQYSNLYQSGGQPGPAGMPFAANQAFMNPNATNTVTPVTNVAPQQTVPQSIQQPGQQQQSQQPTPGAPDATSQDGQQQQDYTEQWIQFYLANGRPDYAEQIIEMKKQAQQQQQSQQPQPPPT